MRAHHVPFFVVERCRLAEDLGRHVDRLKFLAVMLGDEPPLSPAELFYQRMLARDPVEAADQARAFLKENSLGAYYDDILLEGLTGTNQAIEQILLLGQLAAIRLTGGTVRARRILMRHRGMSALFTYRRYFDCDVRFDQPVNAAVYQERDMNRALAVEVEVAGDAAHRQRSGRVSSRIDSQHHRPSDVPG